MNKLTPHDWKSLAVFEGITLGSGGLVAFLTRKSMAFYDTVARPSFAPPGWLFPVAWTVLYAAMAFAAWMIWRERPANIKALLTLYFLQLLVNCLWPVVFFTLEALGLAFVWLILLWALVLATMIGFFRTKKAAGWLLVPYQAWLTFAAVLNFTVAKMN